jgi:hypothetical protein
VVSGFRCTVKLSRRSVRLFSRTVTLSVTNGVDFLWDFWHSAWDRGYGMSKERDQPTRPLPGAA